MQNGLKAMRPRQSRPIAFGVRPKSSTVRPTRTSSQNQSAQSNYERYLTLARAEAQAGNPVGAENYYQHAEHYFRLMSRSQEVNAIDEASEARTAQ
jgi:hypothetical protein